ncbi:MAG: hypothetical protein VB137_09915 [Burkholderia sp.]
MPYGPNGSIRYPVGALREFIKPLPLYASTHEAKLASENGVLGFDTLDALLTPGERLENLVGPGVLTAPLASVVAVLGGLGRYEVQNARDSLKCGLPDLRSRRVGRVRHFPLWQASRWLDGQALVDPEAPPGSALRPSRLALTGSAYVALFDEPLSGWLKGIRPARRRNCAR